MTGRDAGSPTLQRRLDVASGSGGPDDELQRAFFARRKLALEIVLVATAGVLALSWFLRPPGDWFMAVVYPVYVVAFLGLFVVSRRRLYSERGAELLGYALGSSLVLLRLLYHFGVDGPLQERMVALAGGLYWAVAVLIGGGFLILDHRRGAVLGTLVLLLSALITSVGLSFAELEPALFGQTAMELLRVHLFLVAILAVTSATAVTQQHLLRAVARAEILERWAGTDELTSLPNRRSALQLLETSAQECAGGARTFAVLLVDLDHFKVVNDEHGHGVGDEVLRAASRRMQGAVRSEDVVSRWGGEEFLILCPGAELSQATAVAERCRAALANDPICGLTLTATFGVSAWRPGDTTDVLLKRADERLYAGKAAGRNRVVAATAAESSATSA